MGQGTNGTKSRGRLTQAEAQVPQHNTGPGTHGTGFRGRLTPAQEGGGGKEGGRRGRRETKEKTEPQPGGEE